ncbi:hypothetical protein pb186bvf_018139 [Paramecium bursaria]
MMEKSEYNLSQTYDRILILNALYFICLSYIPQVMKSISHFYIIIAGIPQVKKSISLRQAHQQLLDLQIIINNL